MFRRNLSTIVSAVCLIILATTTADAGRVLLFCNNNLWNQSDCRTGISVYANNLHDDGYEIVTNASHYGTIPNFPYSGNVLLVGEWNQGGYLDWPSELRDYIKARYDESGSLVGCVLVGDVAIPHWEYGSDPKPYDPLDIAYMDMDGTWTDSDNNGKFDSRSGDYKNPEIWVGRITVSPLVKNYPNDTSHPYWYGGSKLATEAKIVRNYFERNDAYREGTLTRSHKALVYNDDDQICDGTNGVDYLYSNYLIVGNAEGTENNTTTAADYANRLGQDYEWVHNHSHGTPTHTCFHTPGDGGGWGGGSLVGWINVSAPTPKYSIAGDSPNVQPKPLFYFADNCKTARYDEDNYLGGCYLFHPTVIDRYGLVTIGHAKVSYPNDEVPFYDKLFKRKTVGEAFIESNKTGYYTDPGLSICSYGMTVLGDPTLRAGMGHSVATFQVPSQYSTIQSAVNAAYSAGGGIVYVSPGTYEEQVTMKNGVSLVGVGSGTRTIDGGSPGETLSFNNVTNSRVTGFTLSGFVAVDCYNYSTPKIDHNTINGNYRGIYCGYSSPAVHYNTLSSNEIGISLQYSSDPEMRNAYNTIQNNMDYGILCFSNSEPKLGKYNGGRPTSFGRNNFYTTGSYHIHASSNCGTIWAQKNYWGEVPPDENKIYHAGSDSIVYEPYLGQPAKILAGASIAEATDESGEKRDPLARGRNRQGYELAEEGRYDEALACFKWVIENYPDTQDALFALDNLVETYWEAKRGKEAFDYLQLVAKAYPNSELGALAEEFTIRNYVTDGDYEGAIRVARDLLERFPGRERNKWVEYQIGLIHELADKPAEAEAAFQAFADKYPVNFQNDPNDILPSLARIKLGRSPLGEGETPAGKATSITEVTLDNHPNPFNAQTVISFTLPKSAFVRLEVYNTLGQRVRKLIETQMKAGKHSVIWNAKNNSGRDVSSGIYFYCLKGGDKTLGVRKMLLLR